MIAAFVFVATTVASVVPWENPDVNAINRLPPRTYSMPLVCENDALTDALEPETPYRKSLNGDWKINWVGQPSLRPVGFEKPDYDDSAWDTIDVPSCVEMRGFGVPHYTNIKYPHANIQPLIRDRVATNLVFNPVSSYRTRFTVPETWNGRRVVLRFDGVYSAFYVWVNGKRVGYSEDSTLAAEFDVTDAILVEAGHVLRNLIVDDDFNIENRFGFTNANEFKGEWELVEDGVIVNRGMFDVPDVPPLTKGRLQRPDVELKEGHEYFLNVSFIDKDGWAVSRNQVKCGTVGVWKCENAEKRKCESVKIDDTGESIGLSCGVTKAVFSRRTGTLAKLEMGGRTILEDCGESVRGPRLTCVRAFTDNDFWLRGDEEHYKGWPTRLTAYGFYNSGLSQLRYHAPSVKVLDGGRKIETCVTVNGSKSAGFRHRAVWTFLAGGSIEVENETEPFGEMPDQLPRFGVSWRLDGALTNMTWYGRGPEENYIDRCGGSFVGCYSSTVAEQYVPYARPQDCGYKGDVRWVSFADDGGRGVRFSFSEQRMFVQALHYTWEDLEFARHRAGQLRIQSPLIPRPEVCLNLDLRQCGLGNGSCGNNPTLPQYRFAVKPERWTVRISPLGDEI